MITATNDEETMLILQSRRQLRCGLPRAGVAAPALLAIVVGCSALLAPTALADRAVEVEQAVQAARGSASCGPLTYNPVVEHAADIINRSTYAYLTHTGENVPADGQRPTAIVKDLGMTTDKVISLQGAGQVEADAIKGALIEGDKAIPDCSYTEVGASRLYEEQSGQTLVVVILAGK